MALELSKILNISIEKATELYPILKTQYIYYKVLDICSTFMLIATVIAGVICFIPLTISLLEGESIVLNSSMKNVFTIIAIVFTLSLIGVLATSILSYYLAPDFMIIKEFLNK